LRIRSTDTYSTRTSIIATWTWERAGLQTGG